jgi:hypothetical protein
MRSMRPTAPAVRRRPEAAGAIGRAGTAVAIAVLAFTASGCEGGSGRAGTGDWVQPRGGLVTHGLSADAEALAGRGDADLGHPPEVRGAFGVATIEQRSRTSTERSGRVADHVVRRVRIREIRLR